MVKRDRWDSSSDEEEEPKKTAALPSPADESADKLSKPDECVPKVKDRYKRHNPLLQGCRSVYDTYERIARLGEGTYGIVWKARDLATDEIVALKQIKFDLDDQKKYGFPVTALREISVLLALNHECIGTVKARKWLWAMLTTRFSW